MAWKVALNNLNLNLIPIFLTLIYISSSVIAQEKPTITTKDASTFTNLPNNTRAITDDGHSAQEIASYPVVIFENHTYWPLSYVDNRFSFALVVTQNDAKRNYTYVNTIEAQGARYIKRIYTNTAEETVVFVGQGGREAAVSWDVFRRAAAAAAVGDVKPTVSTDSVTNTAAVSATSSAPPARPSPTGTGKGESITGAVAGGAFGGLVVLVVLVIVVWKCWLSPNKAQPGRPGTSSHHTTKGSVNLSTVSRARTRDGGKTLITSLDDADERAAEARRLGGIPDWQAQTAYARAMSPVERGRGPRGGYHYPFKGDDRA